MVSTLKKCCIGLVYVGENKATVEIFNIKTQKYLLSSAKVTRFNLSYSKIFHNHVNVNVNNVNWLLQQQLEPQISSVYVCITK